MPDGFEPHKELARIWDLREVIKESRLDTPQNLNVIRAIRDDPDVPADTRLRAVEMLLNRAYGKPRQSVDVTDVTAVQSRLVILPDNGRGVTDNGKVIDAEQ